MDQRAAEAPDQGVPPGGRGVPGAGQADQDEAACLYGRGAVSGCAGRGEAAGGSAAGGQRDTGDH